MTGRMRDGPLTHRGARLRTLAIEIVETLIDHPQFCDEGPDRRFLGHGGLLVNRSNGAWHSYTLNKSGWSTVTLIILLRECDHAEAVAWALAWLQAHPGTGSCAGDDIEEWGAAAAASKAPAEDILNRVEDIAHTPTLQYLDSRGVAAVGAGFPGVVRHLSDARSARARWLVCRAVTTALSGSSAVIRTSMERKAWCCPTGAASCWKERRTQFSTYRARNRGSLTRRPIR